MLTATCHCGAVEFSVPHAPEQLTSCNCSICHRPLDPKLERKAVNARLFPRKDIEKIRIRRFDGAVSWKFLD